MNFRELYPSKYLAAHDLCGQEVVVTIRTVQLEMIDGSDDQAPKGVIYFHEHPKGMILNRINGKRIVGLYGEETTHWPSGRVTLYPSEAQYKNELVPCIRIREHAPPNEAPAGFPDPRMVHRQPAHAPAQQQQPVTHAAPTGSPVANGAPVQHAHPANGQPVANGQPTGVVYANQPTNQGPAAGDTQAIPAPTHGAAAGADSQAGAQSQQ